MKIYIVTYGAVHVNIAISMANAYKANGDTFVVLAMPAAIKAMEHSGLPFKTLRDYSHLFPEWDAIYDLGQKLAEQYHNPDSNISFDATCDYYGVSMYFLISELGEKEAQKRILTHGRKAFLPVEAMRRILKHEKPDAVQVSCDVRMELAAVIAAKNMNIPSFDILDAPYVLDNPIMDYILLINEDMKSRYSAFVSAEKLIVTGQPVFEKYYELNQEKEKPSVLSELNLNNIQKSLITYISRQTDIDIKNTFREICSIANRKPWNFVVKLHPVSQCMSDFEDLISMIPDNVKIVKDFYTASLIAASDLVLLHDSTCGFEALLMKKPLIVIDLPHSDLYIDYTEKDAAIFVKDIKDLETNINLVLYDDNTKKRLLKSCEQYESSHDASNNIIKFVHGLKNKCGTD